MANIIEEKQRKVTIGLMEALMFTTGQRDSVRARILELAKADRRVTGGALTGSAAINAEDEWSDVDVAFSITDGVSIQEVLDDWTEVLFSQWGALHYWDLPFGSSIYRVFLLPSGVELDVAVTPQHDFGARGPRFRTLFGTTGELEPSRSDPHSQVRYLVGLCWHHAFHARSSIERGKPWRAEYWISALRDHTLELACIRLGEEAAHARGTDLLPPEVTDPLKATLVRSLDNLELRRALAAATECFISELDATDPALSAQLRPLLRKFGTQSTTDPKLAQDSTG